MPFWKFKYYKPNPDECPIATWYESQTPAVRAAMDAVFIDLAATERWEDEEAFEAFTDKPQHLGLAQVRFEVTEIGNKRQYRVIGSWRQEEREFICLMGFRKNGRSPDPPNVFTIAIHLRTQLEVEGSGVCDDEL